MEIQQILSRLGLNQKEAQVYLALLEMGPSTISDIARSSGLFRPIVYKILPELIQKNLVTVSPKNKTKYYVAESPSKLHSLIHSLTSEFEKALPELDALYIKRGQRPIVKFLEGKKATVYVFSDIVNTLPRGGIFYRYSSTKDGKRGNENLPANYRQLRDHKQIERFVITSEEGAKYKKPRLERAVKVVPKQYGLFDYDVTQIIYGNKVAFIDDNSGTVVIIENPVIAKFQEKIFKILYDKL